MAHVSTDGIKEKVQAVREIVPGRSNNDIVLVLQYYDYSVEQTIQAFLETGAKEALGEWHVPGNKPNNKKKKSKSKQGSSSSSANGGPVNQNSSAVPPDSKSQHADAVPATTMVKTTATTLLGAESSKLNVPSSVDVTANCVDMNTNRNNPLVNDQPSGSRVNSVSSAANSDIATFQGSSSMSSSMSSIPATTGHHSSAASTQGMSQKPTAKLPAATVTSMSVGASSAAPTSQGAQPSAPQQPPSQHQKPKAADTHNSGRSSSGRDRTISERSTASNISVAPSTAAGLEKPRRPNAGLEKSLKDLQRQTVSLQRLRHVIETELEKSSCIITEFFEQIRQRVNERQQTVVSQLANVKTEAYNTLDMRQQRAIELRQSTIRAQTMTDQELAELRADIKIFVGDRKIDEELGSTTRFVGDIDHITKEILNFGTVVPAKISYNQRRPSPPVDSVPSVPSVQRPSVPLSQSRSQPSVSTERTAMHNTTTAQPSSNQTHPLAGKVISQSESVTKYEITELQNQPNSNTAHDSQYRRRMRPGPYLGGRGGGYTQGSWRGGRRGGSGRGGDRYSPPEVMEPLRSAMEGEGERNQSKKSRRRQKKREGDRDQRDHRDQREQRRQQQGKPSEEHRGSAGGQWNDTRPRQQPPATSNHVTKMNGGLMPQHHESNGGDGIDRRQSHQGQEHGGSKPTVNGSHYHAPVPRREADTLPSEKPSQPALETPMGCTESRRPNAQSLGSGDNGIIPLAVRDVENSNKYSVGGPTRATVSVQGGKVVHDSVYNHQEGLPQRESRKRSRIVKNPEDIPVVNGEMKMNGVD